MKSTKMRKFVLGTAMAAAVIGSGASSASATTVSVLGGTWTYGETYTSAGHECYSYFHQPSVYHGAAARLSGNDTVEVWRDAGVWAYATDWGNSGQTCMQNRMV